MKQLFKDDLNEFFGLLESGQNFAVTRYGDGELAIIDGMPIGINTQAYAVDGWKYDGGDTLVSRGLKESLGHTESNFYYLIPCACCNIGAKNKYLNILKCSRENISFANLFINGNYKEFSNRFFAHLKGTKRPVVIIANSKAEARIEKIHEEMNLVDNILFHGNAVENFSKNALSIFNVIEYVALANNNTVFIFSIGPLSEIFIDLCYKINPSNVYLDLGSATDELFLGKVTRPYQNGTGYTKDCIF